MKGQKRCRYFQYLQHLMILIFVSFSPTLLGANTIKISTGHWPPYLSEDLPGGGFVSQIIRESFESEGVDVEFAFLPWSRALAMTKSGKYQASAIWSCTESRSRDFLFSSPLLPYQYVFYHRAAEAFDWEALVELKGKKVGLTQDYSYGETLSDVIESGLVDADVTTSDAANFKKLLLGRIDLFPMDPVVGEAMIRNQFTSQAYQLTFHPKPLRKAFYHVLFNAESAGLRQAFNDGLVTLRNNGRYQAIIEKAVAENSTPVTAQILEDKLVNWDATAAPCSPPPAE